MVRLVLVPSDVSESESRVLSFRRVVALRLGIFKMVIDGIEKADFSSRKAFCRIGS